MRISDWSSDVCSSDLHRLGSERFVVAAGDHNMFDTKHGFTAVTGLNATSSTLEEFASEFISYQANQTADYDSQLGFQDQIRALLDERLKDESGVNIDQELASLIQLESAFAASARRSEEHTSELQSLMRSPYAALCLKK